MGALRQRRGQVFVAVVEALPGRLQPVRVREKGAGRGGNQFLNTCARQENRGAEQGQALNKKYFHNL